MKPLIILVLLVVISNTIFGQKESRTKQKKEQTNTVKVQYTCPMHPDITSNEAGKCSICGRQLVVVDRRGSKQGNITYVCPMHPGVTANKAGKCPKCGMVMIEKSDSTHHGNMKM